MATDDPIGPMGHDEIFNGLNALRANMREVITPLYLSRDDQVQPALVLAVGGLAAGLDVLALMLREHLKGCAGE